MKLQIGRFSDYLMAKLWLPFCQWRLVVSTPKFVQVQIEATIIVRMIWLPAFNFGKVKPKPFKGAQIFKFKCPKQSSLNKNGWNNYLWLWISVPNPLLLELAAESDTQDRRLDAAVEPIISAISLCLCLLQMITLPSDSRTIGMIRSSPEDLRGKNLHVIWKCFIGIFD